MTAQLPQDGHEVSALVQQFLLFHGAQYASRVTEENWKVVPVTLAVPAQPIENLPLLAGEWLIVPWDLASINHLQIWLQRLAAAGPLPVVVVLAMDRPLLPQEALAQLATGSRMQLVGCCATPPLAFGSSAAQHVGHVFDRDMRASIDVVNPLLKLAVLGDPRDPQVFLERLRHASPATPFTMAMLTLNIGAYLLMVAASAVSETPSGGNLMATVLSGFGLPQLVQWGGNAPDLTAHGQPWRLLTSAFLHGNLLHIGMNMLALRQLGATAERLFGTRAFAAVYLLSALGGAVGSFGWHKLTSPHAVSVGASGAVFGVLGATIGFALAKRHTVPPHVYRSLVRSGGFFVAVNVALGLAAPAIDNAAHLGGLCVGVLAGAAFARELPPALQPRPAVQAALAVAFFAVLGLAYRLVLGLG